MATALFTFPLVDRFSQTAAGLLVARTPLDTKVPRDETPAMDETRHDTTPGMHDCARGPRDPERYARWIGADRLAPRAARQALSMHGPPCRQRHDVMDSRLRTNPQGTLGTSSPRGDGPRTRTDRRRNGEFVAPSPSGGPKAMKRGMG